MNYWTKSAWALFLLVLVCDHFLSTQAADSPIKTKRNPWWGRRKRPVCSSSRPADGHHYVNNWDGFFAFKCSKPGQSINSVYSVYRACKRDRVWSFECRYNKAARKNCHWSSHYVNDFDKPVDFTCPNNGFITGIQSEHNNHYEDRRFKFSCCNHHNYVRYACKKTHDINNWQAVINFRVTQEGRGFYLAGAYSHHENSKEDRRWKFYVCKLRFRKGHK